MKRLIAFLLAVLCMCSLVACGGTEDKNEGDGESFVYNVEGANKTQIEFLSFNGGVGSVWIEKAAEEFARINQNTNFGGSHEGVYVHITKDMAIDVDSMASSGYHVYTAEVSAFPNTLAERGLVYCIDDVVKDSEREGGTLEDLIYGDAEGAIMSNGHYYGLPLYECYGTISYNYKIFDQYKLFLTDDQAKGESYGGFYFTDSKGTNGKMSNGPDGVPNTEDDGLPMSMEELLVVMDKTYNTGKVLPMVLSGKYTNYSTYLVAGLWASLAGKEQMTNYYNCSGEVEVCKRGADGNVLLTDEPLFEDYDYIKMPQTEKIILDETNGYRGNDMVAKYYALSLIEIMQHEGWFSKETKNPNADHYYAQIAFLTGKPTYDNAAMICDATYWYNEAQEKNSFKFVSGGEEATDTRAFCLPSNYYAKDAVGKETSFIDISHAYMFVNKNIEGNRQATGCELKIEEESESGLVHSTEEKYFSIGNTKMFQTSGLEVDSSVLKYHGARIVTVDNTIFLFGAYDKGALFAVYDFLQVCFNYEIYAEDCWEIDKNVQNVKLFKYDVTDVPDIALRDCYWAPINSGVNNIATRFRMPDESWILPVGDTKAVQENGQPATDYSGEKIVARTFHNTSEIIPVNATTTDDDWLSSSKKQLCYTAHGNPEKYDAMIQQIAKVLIQSLIDNPVTKNPNAHLFTITVEDTGGFCDCSACNEAEQKYGAKVGAAMVLCNNVMEIVDNWMNQPENIDYKREDFYLMFFAYTEFLSCPAHYDETEQKYVVNHPDLILRDDVGVYYAINDMNYLNSVYDSCNDTARENTLKWFDVSPTTYLWTYETNFHYYQSMFDSFSHFDSEGFQFYAYGRPMIMLNQGDYSSTGVSAFNGLKTFLDYKLQWDCNLDSGELTDQWFNAMFGEAKDVMRKLFNEMRIHFRIMAEEINVLEKYKIEGFDVLSEENYKLPTVNRWLDLIQEAYSINEKYNKSLSPEKYEMIKHHIDCELIFPANVLISLYSKQEVGERYTEIIKYLQQINSELGVYYGAETGAEKGIVNNKWADIVA